MNDITQVIVTAVTVLVSSGLVQFLITRKDKQKEDAKVNREEALKKEMKDHLTSVNDKWKVDYCDKNAKVISDLITEVRSGLNERDKTGRMRYDEHHIAIEKMSLQHQKDFQTLLSAIEQLKENDNKVTKITEEISETQQNIGNAIIGLAHDKIVYTTDKLIERGAVTMKEKATLESIYEPYVALGGNSYAKKGMEHVDKLPVVTDEEARKMDLELKRRS